MIVVLTLEESEDQIISGFPEWIILSTGPLPSTIFYTLDGKDPDEDSEIFIDKLTIPTTGLTITLKAFAKVVDLSGTYYSAIIEKTYVTKQNKIEKTRITGKEGINILPPGKTPIDNLSYDVDGNISQATTIPFQKLDMKGSTSNNKGEDILGSTTLDFINFAKTQQAVIRPIISSPNDNNINFDPKSFYIIIDGSTQEALDSQIVRIINRPHGTMELTSPFYARNIQNQLVTTSNFVRYMINPITNKIVLYYRESREGRWIKSIQKTEIKTLNLSPTESPPSSFVFRWIEDRAPSRIY